MLAIVKHIHIVIYLYKDGSFYKTAKPKKADYYKVRVIKKNLVYIIGLAPSIAKN